MWMSRVIVAVLVTCLSCANGQNLCNEASLMEGIGYRFHPTDCSQYLQCHTNPINKESVVVYRSCPYGYYWNQQNKNCLPKAGQSCAIEKCVGQGDFHRKMQGSGCRAFWNCKNQRNEAKCCDPGYRYIVNQGCVADFTCTDPCPGPCAEMNVCRMFPNWQKPETLNFYFRGKQLDRICPTGSHFDVLECGCVSSVRKPCNTRYITDFTSLANTRTWLTTNVRVNNGAATFNAGSTFTASVKAAMPSVQTPLVIRFRFREFTRVFNKRNLITSRNCKKCNVLSVDLNGSSLEITLAKFGKIQAFLSVSMQGLDTNSWKDVAIHYNGREIVGMIKSNGITYLGRVEAPKLSIMDCGMTFGMSQGVFGVSPFSGFLDSFSVYSCTGGGRILDLMNMV